MNATQFTQGRLSFLNKWDLRKLTKVFVVAGIIVAAIGSYLWYSRVYMSDERVFWSAIENSMSTPSVTRGIKSGGTGNEVTQKQQIFFAPQSAFITQVSFNQSSATETTNVVTEGRAFPDALYTRYVAFETNQQSDDGSVPTLRDVLGKWEKNVATDETLEQAQMDYMSELVTLVMFGNYSPEFRHGIIQELKDNNVYDIDESSILEEDIEGEPAKTYTVSVQLKRYVELLQESLVHSGYGELAMLDPSGYDEGAVLEVKIAVSTRSGSVIGVTYGTRQETYTGYGIIKTVERPEAEFESGELERRVQEELKGAL